MDKNKLIIAYAFPPYEDSSGNVIAKRIIDHGNTVDIIQNNFNNAFDYEFNEIVDKYIDKRIIIESPTAFLHWNSIKIFFEKGIMELEKLANYDEFYDSIYSRAMHPASHFLAFEYKIKYPDTHWVAEFSDPILFDIMGDKRISKINDPKYIEKLFKLSNINKGQVNEDIENVAFWAEALPYLFADEIIFTNINQRKHMISYFSLNEMKEKILSKSIIEKHPVPKGELYRVKESNYEVKDSFVNFAYFGIFYGTRTLEDLYYAFSTIDSRLKDKYKIHIFTSDTETLKNLISNIPIKDNIIINKSVPFLEFLNLTTKFDCLIVNDAITSSYKDINPYLPSKYSDYLGSNKDIWAICEKGSSLDSFDLSYKSYIGDYFSSKKVAENIIINNFNLNDYPLSFNEVYDTYINVKAKNDLNISKNDLDFLIEELFENIEFLTNRNTQLNIYNFEVSRNNRFLKNKKNAVENSNRHLTKKITALKQSVREVSQIKSYKLGYFLYRMNNEFFKGNLKNKKAFLKWCYFKIMKKENNYNGKNNPLFKIYKE